MDKARKYGGSNGVKKMAYETPEPQLLEGESWPHTILSEILQYVALYARSWHACIH